MTYTTLAQTLKELGISKAMGTMLEAFGGTRTVRGNTNTIVALINRGMVTPKQDGPDGYGNYYTSKGIETTDVIREFYGLKPLSSHYAWVREFMAETLDDMIAAEIQGAPVEIIGDEPEEWAPEFSAPGVRECYYGCGNVVTHVFVDYVGRTEGLCAGHVERVEGKTYPMPLDAPESDAESVDECAGTCPVGTGCKHCDDAYGAPVAVVAIVQDTPGMASATHYHAPGCRDIARELKRYGQSEADIIREEFSSVADILVFECGDIASDDAEDGTLEWWESVCNNSRYSSGWGIKIMPCLSDKLRAGMTLDTRPLIVKDGTIYIIGEPLPTMATVAALTTGAGFHTVEDDDTDGGFMETDDMEEITEYVMSNARKAFMVNSVVRTVSSEPNYWEGVVTGHAVKPYEGVFLPCAIVLNSDMGEERTIPTEALEFNIQEVTVVPTFTTGTTHHTMDANGGQWERFEHVLSEGDVVKISRNRGYGRVHCTIPGIAIVYVDMSFGDEPFPYPATDVIAI